MEGLISGHTLTTIIIFVIIFVLLMGAYGYGATIGYGKSEKFKKFNDVIKSITAGLAIVSLVMIFYAGATRIIYKHLDSVIQKEFNSASNIVVNKFSKALAMEMENHRRMSDVGINKRFVEWAVIQNMMTRHPGCAETMSFTKIKTHASSIKRDIFVIQRATMVYPGLDR